MKYAYIHKYELFHKYNTFKCTLSNEVHDCKCSYLC